MNLLDRDEGVEGDIIWEGGRRKRVVNSTDKVGN